MTLHYADTIAAISTPRGYSGIGVIRMSGPESIPILRRIFLPAGQASPATKSSQPQRHGDTEKMEPIVLSVPLCLCGEISEESPRPDKNSDHSSTGHSGDFPDRVAMWGLVRDPESGKTIDDAIALVMRGPRSFTGEDVVEISMHGSPTALDLAVAAMVRLGARPAGRGEFTLRAFMSGKIDLIQAEAVIDLIESPSPVAVEDARGRLNRSLSDEVNRVSDALKDLLAALEAHIDFDEEDQTPRPDIEPELRLILGRMDALITRAAQARLKRQGLRTTIVGKPNVGKSTLFNALLGSDRTIVTPYPGTTRDIVEDHLVLGGLSFVLSDTAGIRNNPEPIEQEGIRRTMDAIQDADLVIVVVDRTSPWDREDTQVLELSRQKDTVVVLNKSDLPPHPEGPGVCMDPSDRATIELSAKTGKGVDSLRQALEALGSRKSGLDEAYPPGGLTERSRLLMEGARSGLESLLSRSAAGLEMEPSLSAEELRRALRSIEEITGERYDEGVLERIFARFCVGK